MPDLPGVATVLFTVSKRTPPVRDVPQGQIRRVGMPSCLAARDGRSLPQPRDLDDPMASRLWSGGDTMLCRPHATPSGRCHGAGHASVITGAPGANGDIGNPVNRTVYASIADDMPVWARLEHRPLNASWMAGSALAPPGARLTSAHIRQGLTTERMVFSD